MQQQLKSVEFLLRQLVTCIRRPWTSTFITAAGRPPQASPQPIPAPLQRGPCPRSVTLHTKQISGDSASAIPSASGRPQLPLPLPQSPPCLGLSTQMQPSVLLPWYHSHQRHAVLAGSAASLRPMLNRWPPWPPQLHPRQSSSSAGPGFGALRIAPELQERLAALGMERALPVQTAAVPLILGGRNVAIKSCTGSGKTLAYLLPVIQLALERRRAAVAAAAAAGAAAPVATSNSSGGGGGAARQAALRSAALKQQARSLQALILAPSRELCIQIQRTAQDLMPAQGAGRGLVQQLIGGANPKRQAAALAGGDGGVWPLVVVGTPGRVAELVTTGMLHVWGCPLLVMDEVDQLLAHNDFCQHVDTIASHAGRRARPEGGSASGIGSAGDSATAGRHTVIVSASLDGRDLGRYAAWCPDPVLVALGSSQALPPQLLQLPQPSSSQPEEETAAAGAVASLGGGVASSCSAGLEGGRVNDEDAAAGGESQGASYSSAAPERRAEASPSSSNSSSSNAGTSAADAASVAGLDEAAAGPLTGVLPPHLVHLYVMCPAEHRTDYVRRLIHSLGAERALLFVSRQSQAMVTKYKLEARRMEVSILHGKLSKMERGNILDAFRRGVFRALVVTDLGARGLDLPDCDAVINLGTAPDALAYAHRAGRTGRAGAPGVVASVVTRTELQQLRSDARRLGLTLQAASVSHGTIAPGDDMESSREEGADSVKVRHSEARSTQSGADRGRSF